MNRGYGMRGPRPGYMDRSGTGRGPPFAPRGSFYAPYPGMPAMAVPPMNASQSIAAAQQSPAAQAERLKRVLIFFVTYCLIFLVALKK